MEIKNIFLVLILISLLAGCHKKKDVITMEPPEGSINLKELETRHDYYLPFAIVNDTGIIASAILNDEPVGFEKGDFISFTENGFYELIIRYKDNTQPDDTFLFTTTTEERANSEWGIRAWTPSEYEYSNLGSEDIEMFYPRSYTDSINIPFIFYVKESGSLKAVYCRGENPSTGKSFNLKRGAGSVSIPSSALSGGTTFKAGGRSIGITMTKIQGLPVSLNGTIDYEVVIPSNALVKVGDLNITSSGSLTINDGAIVLVAEGADINLSGPVLFSGKAGNPILVTCSQKDKFWGGFITRSPGGTLEAGYTIFCQSGYHNSDDYAWGHAGRQALFYTENSTLKLDHCFMTDHIGQIFYPLNSVLTFNNILVQRAMTGGQINGSELSLRNSIFTDFPDDSYDFRDEDNDALYLNATNAVIDSTTFMFAKDDGLDSGAGEGGTVTISNCRFESCFHEGAALSSISPAVKNHTFTNCVFTNCGQGLELGYSSPYHSVVADNCMFLKNGIGVRYGDNYDWSEVDGKMLVKNSFSLDNDRDVWNMVRMTWSPKVANLNFVNTKISKFCPQYPGLELNNQTTP